MLDLGDKPIDAITTTPKTTATKSSRDAKKKAVSVEKKVVSKRIPTKDSKTKKTTAKDAETKKTKVKETEVKETEVKKITTMETEVKKIDAKKTLPILKKVKRAKVIIVNMDFYEQMNSISIPMNIPMNNNDSELSDEDFEDDVPYQMDKLTLPNSNTDREVMDKLKSTCNLCQYQAVKGWKQLTKHYVRKHPNCEIPISRLAKDQNPTYLSKNPCTLETIESATGERMVKSHCPICNEVYIMRDDKWLHHFIAHTGR